MTPDSEHGGETQTTTFEEIEWPVRPQIVQPDIWESGKQVVGWLCELGAVSERCTNTSYKEMPVRYVVDGQRVMFLPHWGCYIISSQLLRKPTSREEISCDIQAVKSLNLEYLEARRSPPAAPPQAQA